MVGFYNLSVYATYTCLLSSFVGVVCAMRGDFATALIFLMISGLLDAVDGSIAGCVKRNSDEKCFGIQIDSLCDSFSFGVAPIIIAYCTGMNSTLDLCVLFLFLLCGIVRLAYYNVFEEKKLDESLEGLNPEEKAKAIKLNTNEKTYCYGIPITVISFTLPIVVFFASRIKEWIPVCESFNVTDAIRILMIISIPAMLVKIRINKIGNIGKVIAGILAIVLCVCIARIGVTL